MVLHLIYVYVRYYIYILHTINPIRLSNTSPSGFVLIQHLQEITLSQKYQGKVHANVLPREANQRPAGGGAGEPGVFDYLWDDRGVIRKLCHAN